REQPHRRAAQRRLAEDVTVLVHGVEATQAAIDASAALFGSGSYDTVADDVLKQAVAELESATITDETSVAQALVDTALAKSLSDARRTVSQGGATVNGTKVTDAEDTVRSYVAGRALAVLGRGKKQKAALYFS